MLELHSFDSWTEAEGLPEGSGTSEKLWLQNEDKTKCGLFKFPKTQEHEGGATTTSTEHVSEWLAYQLGRILDIACAEVELGLRDGRIGSLGMLITEPGVDLVEGVNFICEKYPTYNAKNMYDPERECHYCLQDILDSTLDYVPAQVWIEMLMFDFLIGNADRHQSNWALLKCEGGGYQRCPLYDNGSSLCCYVPEEQVRELLSTKDQGRIQSLTDTKSRSMIRIDGKISKRPTHKEMARHVLKTYPRIAGPIAKKMLKEVPEHLADLLALLPDQVFSAARKELVTKYIETKLLILESFD